MTWQQNYLARWYPKDKGWMDGTTEFHCLCERAVSSLGGVPSLLEIGAGPSNPTSDFLGRLGLLTGVDTDAVVLTNRALKQATVVHPEDFPFPGSSFDVCFSNWVLEHVENPVQHLQEVWQILRPGGLYIFRTPNRFHYVTLVSALTPHWFHVLVANRLRHFVASSLIRAT